MRLQVAHPDQHAVIATLPLRAPLDTWSMDNVHPVLGLHRHVVKLVELDDVSYVVKELPDHLAQREYRLLREIDDDGLPTVEVVAVVTDRGSGEGLVVTRHLDYSLPYRSLLMGRGLKIPYLGDRMLDALVVLLARVHLAGYFWGDCSLSNTLFRRDAGNLQAYIIDVETAEHHHRLSDGQRATDLMIATDNVAGGLLDLQAAGRLEPDIDPIDVALAIGDRYDALWAELTEASTAPSGDIQPLRQRIARFHELGFDVEELEVVATEDGSAVRYVPKVVEHGYHAERLKSLTGLEAGENQARRMLDDITSYSAYLQGETGRSMPINVAAVRWLDRVFEPVMEAIPKELLDRLEAAEIFHQLLEHRWFLAEHRGEDVKLIDALADYLGVLESAPSERRQYGDRLTSEVPVIAGDPATDDDAAITDDTNTTDDAATTDDTTTTDDTATTDDTTTTDDTATTDDTNTTDDTATMDDTTTTDDTATMDDTTTTDDAATMDDTTTTDDAATMDDTTTPGT